MFLKKMKVAGYILCTAMTAAFIYIVDWDRALGLISALSRLSLGLFCALTILSLAIGLIRFRMILGNVFGLKRTAYVYFLSKTGGSLTPGRVGDFAPFFEKEYRRKETAFAILLDKTVEFYALLFVGTAGILLMNNLPLPLILCAVITFALATAFMLLLRRQPLWERAHQAVSIRFSSESGSRAFLARLLTGFFSMAEKVSFETLRIGVRYPAALGMSALSFSVTIVATQVLLRACSIDISYFLLLEMMTLSGLLMVISFIPSGFGIVELSLLYVMTRYGVDKNAFGAYAVVARFLGLALPFTLYLTAFLLTRNQNKHEHTSH
ncbi:MAG: lysylphosphatidylglycerol synthase transmembrane domain-containing protein [Fibrobacterota bacterium]